jgi:hypothetical protein
MFTANKFLRNTNYDILPGFIRSDPIRLRKEFLAIATNPKEDSLFRLRSLRILNLYAQVFGLFTPLEKQSLTMAFESEFPPERLQEVGRIARSGACGYIESWLLFCYCITVARITLNEASDILNATREVFKGTSRGRSLEVHLNTIEDFKTHAVRFDQMEAG